MSTSILGREQICERLGVKTWKTALRRLNALGISPTRAGRGMFITDRQLEDAISGARHTAQGGSGREPNWDAL